MEEGGQQFHYIPCLNDQSEWISALAHVAQQHMSGWPVGLPPSQEGELTRKAALAMGAQR